MRLTMRLSTCGNVFQPSCFLFSLIILLTACGGGGGSSDGGTPSNPVTISGTATYDFIPANNSNIGLNYSAVEVRPIRGAVVELINASNRVLTTTSTNEEGFYSAVVSADSSVRVRIRAHLLRTQTPSWDIAVTDNTNNNSFYVLDGSLANSGSSNSQRNLHASSGWGGSSYTSTRAAAPFAILDAVYTGLQRLNDAGNSLNFPPLDLRWSVNNNTANGDLALGEIGTSFFFDDAIYILGEVNADTDEFDSHVILHEWGHYVEAALSRADSIGGAHEYGDYLDMRVAFSEGFGNAFSAMMLDDPNYRDSGGSGQASGFTFNVSETNHEVRGWYSEASVESVLYNYYTSSNNKTARDFAPILTTLTSSEFYNADSIITIFLFAERLIALFPNHQDLFESLLEVQDINSVNQYGTGENNNGGNIDNLPIYKTLSTNGVAVNVCSTSMYGKYNKLGVSQFFRLDIAQNDIYTIRVDRSGGDFVSTDPDFFIYEGGEVVGEGLSQDINLEIQDVSLAPGNYILEVYDWNNADSGNGANNTTCFDVRVSP